MNKKEELRLQYEKGFEDGYSMAKRNYKPVGIHYLVESELRPLEQKIDKTTMRTVIHKARISTS